MTDRISGGAFKQMVAFGAACITAQKQAINDLNVFPVPDGDTGTNMSLTIQTAVTELRRVEPVHTGGGRQDHGLRPAAGRPRQLRRYPVPAVPGHEQGVQGAGTRRTAHSWPPPCRRASPPPTAR